MESKFKIIIKVYNKTCPYCGSPMVKILGEWICYCEMEGAYGDN